MLAILVQKKNNIVMFLTWAMNEKIANSVCSLMQLFPGTLLSFSLPNLAGGCTVFNLKLL